MNTIDYSQIAEKLLPLAAHDRYLAAFIFELSDPFIKIIVEEKNCINLSHLEVGNVVVGISFVSFDQFEDALKGRQKQNRRPSMLEDSIIIFDKTGRLAQLKQKYAAAHPRAVMREDHQMIRFTLLWADNKIKYAMAKGDLLSANLGMHTNLNDILKMHYALHTKWSKNDKRMLADLGEWDTAMAGLIEDFLKETDIQTKHTRWNRMIAYILDLIGGLPSTMDNNCSCANCAADLELLT